MNEEAFGGSVPITSAKMARAHASALGSLARLRLLVTSSATGKIMASPPAPQRLVARLAEREQ